MKAGDRVRLPNGKAGEVKYVFTVHPFIKDVSVAVDGKEERELWAMKDLRRIVEVRA